MGITYPPGIGITFKLISLLVSHPPRMWTKTPLYRLMVERVESLSTAIVDKILRSQLWISLDKLLAIFSRRKQGRNNQGLMHNSERLSTNLADLSTFFGFLTVL